jgi:DNA-3-methyladenine glycosylase
VSEALRDGFFDRPVNGVARDLIGCSLAFDGVGGVIVETEAYDATDPACHAYNGLTPRNEPLFGPPGVAYVYLSYGMHQMLNAVAEPEGSAAAVLIRALEPRHGIDRMRRRRGLADPSLLCSGPGKLTQALGIGPAQNATSLSRPPFELGPPDREWSVETGVRIGITKGVGLPWRYCAAGSRYLSLPVRSAPAA